MEIASQIKEMARKGHIDELEAFYKAHKFDDIEIEGAAVIAAGCGRVAILEFFEPLNHKIDQTQLIQFGVLGDRTAVARYFEERGVKTFTPENVSIAVQHDSARMMGYWLDCGMVEDPVAVASEALHYNAVFCLEMLLRLDIVQNNDGLIMRIRDSERPVRELVVRGDVDDAIVPVVEPAPEPEPAPAPAPEPEPAREPAPAPEPEPAPAPAPAPYSYTCKTPSEHINVHYTTIRFLLYRRFIRTFFVRFL